MWFLLVLVAECLLMSLTDAPRKSRGRGSQLIGCALLLTLAANLGHAQPATPEEILDRYLRAKVADAGEAVIEVGIDASIPRLKKHGTMQALRLVSRAGQVAYIRLRFSGDDMVKRDVIARYLYAEMRRRPGDERLAISASNYRFRYGGPASYNGMPARVFRVEPRKKRPGLFRGELWLDPETGMPFREWGDFVRSPSVFLKQVRFVRDYVLDGNRARVRRLILSAHAIIVGTVQITVWFGSELSRQACPAGESTESDATTRPGH